MTERERRKPVPWRRVLLLLLAGTILLIAVAGGWVLYPRKLHPPEAFLRHKGELVSVQVLERNQSGGVVTEDLLLQSSSGLEIRAWLRRPDGPSHPRAAFLLMGGMRAGRRALEGLPVDRYPLVWMAIDYHYAPPPAFPGPFSLMSELNRVEEGLEKTVAGLCLALDYLEQRPDVDPSRTGIGGGSLGAFVAVLAGALDPGFDAVVALYGGAPAYRVVENTLKFSSPIARKAMALFLKPWLDRVDPIRFVPDISPRPFLMVNGREDAWIPRECVEALYEAARDPKEIHWVDTPHVIQGRPEFVGQVAEVAVDWLASQGWLKSDPIPR